MGFFLYFYRWRRGHRSSCIQEDNMCCKSQPYPNSIQPNISCNLWTDFYRDLGSGCNLRECSLRKSSYLDNSISAKCKFPMGWGNNRWNSGYSLKRETRRLDYIWYISKGIFRRKCSSLGKEWYQDSNILSKDFYWNRSYRCDIMSLYQHFGLRSQCKPTQWFPRICSHKGSWNLYIFH